MPQTELLMVYDAGPNDPRFFGGMGGDTRLPGGLP